MRLCHDYIGHEPDEVHAAKDEKEDVEKDNPATYHITAMSTLSTRGCCNHYQRVVAIVIVCLRVRAGPRAGEGLQLPFGLSYPLDHLKCSGLKKYNQLFAIPCKATRFAELIW
jgi:hypothetical protein